jgi:hypothetical protein
VSETPDIPVVTPDPNVIPDPDVAPVGQGSEPVDAGDGKGAA